ncbi:anti-sigma factor family protein [Collimonas humicola]|uniref:anti-sigma factor family protein n=1 Tax=Collimonas humicola TaxID=2825886 RepID=UPI001B8BCB91|nr:anti-sigma factor [Collimonas humicola]
MTIFPVTEADLHAYVDGLLPAVRHAEIEAYLASRPDELARVRVFRAQNASLRALFDPVLDEPVPARLSAPPRNYGWMLQCLAAGLVIAVASGGAGWTLHGQHDAQLARTTVATPATTQQFASFARQAAIAHVVFSPDVKRPVEIGANQEDQLVAWLSKRIGTQIRPPKLGKLGYELIGGRLLPGQSGPVAQFMYHDATGQRLTLYVSTEQALNKNSGFKFAQEGPVNVFYWIDGKFGYALSAGINKGELARIATNVYEQLEKPS